MMDQTPPSSPEGDLFSEFIDDYFIECDEHLAIARRSLLALEPALSNEQIDSTHLDELFRSCHTIKGLSAMVGVREAESLAHEMESYLGALRKGKTLLSVDGLDALIDAVNLLEQIVGAKRLHATSPSIDAILDRFRHVGSEDFAQGSSAPIRSDSQGPLSVEKKRQLESAVAAGAIPLVFTFIPSPALAERGLNVNNIRQRLEGIGHLLSAAPLVLGQGQIAFNFLVVCPLVLPEFSSWVEDGLTFAPYETLVDSSSIAPDAAHDVEPAAAAGATLAISNVVRVDLGRLDALMRMVGELVISRARLDVGLKRAEATVPATEWRALQEINQSLERQLRDLREGIMHVRMVPIRDIFARMQFVVRDLTREFQKKIVLTLQGEETEIDKFIVERIMDPLLHLVRNAVSHGLETSAERTAQGKSADGHLALRAFATGETIRIEVADDGRGVDVEAVLSKARSQGFADLGESTSETLLDIVCSPGFSTRDTADRASGRGMGMSVVRDVVEELGGTLALETSIGRGTTFFINLPLTLSIADALIVTAGDQTFAVPQSSVREVVEVAATAISAIENNELFLHRGVALPFIRLAAFFGLANQAASASVLIVGEGRSAVGIGIDRVLGMREIVVRPLTDPLLRVPGVGGATELGDGRAVLILDASEFIRGATKGRGKWRSGGTMSAASPMTLAGA